MMTLHEIPKDTNWKRRALTLPGWYLMAAIMLVALPVFAPFTALYDVLLRRRLSTTRTLLFFTYFFVLESSGLVMAAGHWLQRRFGMDEQVYQLRSRELQRWWARGLFWGCVRIFSMKVKIDGLDALEDPRPALVFARHVSTLDTMLPLAIVRKLKLFRYVIKAELLADPALDVVGQRFPNVFVRRGGVDPEIEIHKILALSQNLEQGGAVVVYPEGTRFSRKKREQLIEKFENDPDRLAIAKSLNFTLPPLREGALKLLAAAPEADVVFIAHRGIDRARAMSALVSGALTHVTLEIAIWRHRAADVPRDQERVREFLLENWQRIDRFVSESYIGSTPDPDRIAP
ncbi:MAG: 1-acyl-sn-glycerol-3-phosphate acyltransferase [Bradymonadaceae bacterium]|nr:1-acyl-sn-glycerol-3-phosphate acyltransferase [Lujinxingiaceae bacterium]